MSVCGHDSSEYAGDMFEVSDEPTLARNGLLLGWNRHQTRCYVFLLHTFKSISLTNWSIKGW